MRISLTLLGQPREVTIVEFDEDDDGVVYQVRDGNVFAYHETPRAQTVQALAETAAIALVLDSLEFEELS